MATTISKTQKKRLPKGFRTHLRRMKQEARKEGTIYTAPKIHHAPGKVAGE